MTTAAPIGARGCVRRPVLRRVARAPDAERDDPGDRRGNGGHGRRRTAAMPRGVAHGEARGQWQGAGHPAELRDDERDEQHHAEYGGDGRGGDVDLAAGLAGAVDRTGNPQPEQHRAGDRRAQRRARLTAATREHGNDVVLCGEQRRCEGSQDGARETARSDAADVAHRQLEGTEPFGAEVLHPGWASQAMPTPPTDPTTAATDPSTSPLASTTRRMSGGSPPVAAIRASERCWRRAPTAKAGPASRTTSSSAMATTSASTVTSALLVPPLSETWPDRADAGGGCSTTLRDSTSSA